LSTMNSVLPYCSSLGVDVPDVRPRSPVRATELVLRFVQQIFIRLMERKPDECAIALKASLISSILISPTR